MYRAVLHEKLRVTLQELETHWSFEDLWKMHQMLDALENAEAQARAQ